MSKKLGLAWACLLYPLVSPAQAPAPADTVFYGPSARQLPSRAGAVRYITSTGRPDGGVLQKTYALSGALLEQIAYADAQASTREGVALSWYPSGEFKGRRTYKDGLVEGQSLLFYQDGTLQQVRVYQQGDQKSKQCFAPNGQPETCPPETNTGRVYAAYQSGPAGLATEVRNRTRFPGLPGGEAPLRCQVVVACMIGVDGRLRESRVYKSVAPAYDAEALRVVRGLRGSWSPQLLNGEPEESFYTVEVNFLPKTQ